MSGPELATGSERAGTGAAGSGAPEDQSLRLELSEDQRQARQRFRNFTREHITPFAGEWDRQGWVPESLLGELRQQGLLGAPAARELGGGGMDPITYGLLTEEIAHGCSSVRSLLTVHDMVTLGVAKWGSPRLRARWMPALARGDELAALALSEPGIGSDAAHVETRARRDGDGWVLEGHKKWITFGQIADVFLVLAQCDENGELQNAAFLVPAATPGLTRRPLTGMVGTRASMLAEVRLDDCRISTESLVGKVGFGFSAVVNTVLDHGRYSVAWGAVGIAQACLDACLDYTETRRQFGVPLKEHQLVSRKLTDMIAQTRAARLLCCRAGYLRQLRDPGAGTETLVAKYFASRVATRAANNAIQLHGANGLSEEYPLERYLRDARVTEIIEGSTQIQQLTIAAQSPFLGEL